MALHPQIHPPTTHTGGVTPHRRARPAPVIVADRLSKRFGEHLAVDDLSFEVHRGLVTGFLGPNGSGKTTTIRMILQLARPTSGVATIDGLPFNRLPDASRWVGIAIDGAAAHPRRTGRDHLRILAVERGVPSTRVGEVLAAVELTDAADKLVGEYSLGMRRRLDLAAALLAEPAVLILDEPANGLDPAGIRWLRDFLKSYATAGGTVLVSSHQLAEVGLIADEVIVINRGRLVTQTSVSELTANHTVKVVSPQAEGLARAVTDAGGVIHRLDGTSLSVMEMAPEDIGRLAFEVGAVLYELTPLRAALEDVFLELTTEGPTS